jgi:hypothetical protein
VSKKSDPLNARWDSLGDFREQYIMRSSGETVLESMGHTLVTDRANYTMAFGRVTRDEHPAAVKIESKPLKSKKKKTS